MYVDVLTLARHTCERQWSEMTAAPGWPDIEDAVKALDGERTSLLTLGTDQGCMTIGGGRDGYLVWATFDSERYHAAIDPATTPGPRQLQLNGRPRACGAHQVVNRVVALRAARAFALDGRLEPTVCWEAS